MSTDHAGRRARPALPLLLIASALLLLLPGISPAAAQSRAAKIADALRESPVYVDDGAYASAVDAGRQRKLVAQIEKTGLPIKVALVPLVKGDDFGGDAGTLAEVLHSRLGGDLILITTSDMAGWLRGYEWPDGKHQAHEAVGAVSLLEEMKDVGLAGRVEKAIELIHEGEGKRVYEEATADLGDGGPREAKAPAGDSAAEPADSGSGGPWLVVAVIAAAVAVAAAALLYVRRHRTRGTRAGAPFASPQAVFAAAREADEGALRRRAEDEVVALGEAAQAADGTATGAARLRTALDAYAAAGTVLDGARTRADLAGVLALVAEGRDALQAAPDALPLCFFNPLHGRAARRIRWRLLGHRHQLHVAACATCAQAVRTRRAPEVLTDDLDDRSVPYFELPPERSLWAATGYGSLIQDSLAGRVARGDFTRTRR